jgi:hypothetical protein
LLSSCLHLGLLACPGNRMVLSPDNKTTQGILRLILGLAFHSSVIKLHFFSVVVPLNPNPFKKKFKESKT